jgi:hypothetical protein
VREHATSVHLLLDPTDSSQLEVEARQHPELTDTFYVTVDSLRCHIALSGPAEPLLAVVERMRAQLVATLSAAGRADRIRPEEAEPATTSS